MSSAVEARTRQLAHGVDQWRTLAVAVARSCDRLVPENGKAPASPKEKPRPSPIHPASVQSHGMSSEFLPTGRSFRAVIKKSLMFGTNDLWAG